MDAAYHAKVNDTSLLEAQGGFGIMEDILCTYMDLDRLIDACEFDETQMNVIKAVMDGYSTRDIDDMRGWTSGRANNMLQAMTRRIMRENDRRWKQCYGVQHREEVRKI